MQKAAATDRPTDAVFTPAKQARSLQAAAPIFPPLPLPPSSAVPLGVIRKTNWEERGGGQLLHTLACVGRRSPLTPPFPPSSRRRRRQW